jgi:outer membrane lipoprotein carrier protein
VAELEGKKYTIQLDKQQRLQSIAYFDELDNKVQIVFKHMKYRNGKLSSKEMQCNYPAVYDLIRG